MIFILIELMMVSDTLSSLIFNAGMFLPLYAISTKLQATPVPSAMPVPPAAVPEACRFRSC